MDILIIGNSHVIALEAAIKELDISKFANIDFILAAGGMVIEHYDFSNLQVKAKHKKALEFDIKNLDEYDVIFVYGLRLRSWADGTNNWLQLVKESNLKYISSAARLQSYKDYITESANYRALLLLVQLNLQDKVISVPTPLPIERKRNINADTKYIKHFNELMKQEVEKLSIKFLPLPKELECDNGIFTQKKYKTSKKEDFNHIDKAGGKIILKHFISSAYSLVGKHLDSSWKLL